MSCKPTSELSVQGLHCPAKPPVPPFLSQDRCLLNWKCLVPSEDSHLGLPRPGEHHACWANGCSGGKGLDSSCLLLLGEDFLGSLFHSETTVETLMLPADLSYSLWACFALWVSAWERNWGGERLLGLAFIFLFFFSFLFFSFSKNAFWPRSFPKSGWRSVK